MADYTQTSRVKFIDDLEGHFCYLDFLMKSNGSVGNQSVSAERHKNDICRERKIFVKAALQLLDAQEKNVISSLIVPSLIGNETDFDIIRSGYLKKGTRVSKIIPNMGLSSSKSSYTWKNKYVELRHGEFSYYDDTIEETPLASASLHSYHTSNHLKLPHHPHAGGPVSSATTAFAFKKSISLSPDICSCRVLQYSGGGRGAHHQSQLPSERDDECDHHSSEYETGPPSTPSAHSAFVPTHAFEICLLGGQRRLFLTNSAEESREWVRDILTAMVGGKPAAVNTSMSFAAPAAVPAQPEQVDRKLLFPGLGLPLKRGRQGRQEGGAGPYASVITEYLNLQQRLHAVREEEGYKNIVRELVDRRVRVVVPVAFIKTKCSDGSFAVNKAVHMPGNHADGTAVGGGAGSVTHFSGLNSLLPGKQRLHLLGRKSHHKKTTAAGEALGNSEAETTAAVCVEKSQMWKDLQRDEVCVNGECVAGASDNSAFFGSQDEQSVDEGAQGGGAEAIVGLLVRHIADAVDSARSELLSLLLKTQPQAPHANHHLLLQVMTEAQIVQCARSVLMMCNRTQSGGDTYYCVETLLRRRAHAGDPKSGSNSSDVFILAPLSIKTDPLSIGVDIVETDRSFFDPLLNGAQHLHQEKTSLFATPNGTKAELNESSPRTDFIDALAAAGAVNNGSSSPSVPRTATFDTLEGESLSRRSSRRLHQFKLSLDEELGHHPERGRMASLSLDAGSVTPSAPSKLLRSEFFNILEENSSQTSGSTQEHHPRHRPHPAADPQFRVSLSSGSEDVTVPLRVLSIDDPAAPEGQQEQEQDNHNDMDMDMLGASYSNSHTPPYLLGNRDDSTVISDITFDTTAAFSQHTAVASYHQQQLQQQQQVSVSLGCAAEAELVSPQPTAATGKKSHLKPKSLMKMISSRMPTKQTMGQTPGGSMMMNSYSSQDLQDTEHQPAHIVVGAVTPGRTRRGSHSSATENNNGAIPSSTGAMFTSLFKRERSRTDKLDQLSLDSAPAATTAGLRGVETEDPSRNSSPTDRKACVCVRLRVRGVSRYRVCSADPQGDPEQDNWAVMEGAFTQTFFVPAAVEGDSMVLTNQHDATAKGVDGGKGLLSSLPAAAMVVAGPVPAALSRLAMTDRLVSISAHKYECE